MTARVRTVLLATDLTPASDAATATAIELALQLAANLLVLHVLDPRHGLLRGVSPQRRRPVEDREDMTQKLQGVVASARATGVVATFLVWDGEAAPTILAAATAEDADLIVLGTRSRGPFGRLLGSVSDAVLRQADVPVLVVRPGQTVPSPSPVAEPA